MQPSEMAEVLTAAFVSSWPTFQVTEPTVRLWADAFQLMDRASFWELMKAALKTHTGNYPPTIGQVDKVLRHMLAANEPSEGELWGLLRRAITGFGRTRPEAAREYLTMHGGERLAHAVRCLGWNELCQWQVSDETANRAHFWRVYSGLKGRDEFKAQVGRKAIEAVTPRLAQTAANIVMQLEAK